jgi:hypothetical protein
VALPRVDLLSCWSGPLESSANPFGVRENIELFDPDANPLDTRVGKAGGANPLRETFAQIDVSGCGDIADRCHNLLVIDDAPAALSRVRVCGIEIDRDANALAAFALACAYSDPAP